MPAKVLRAGVVVLVIGLLTVPGLAVFFDKYGPGPTETNLNKTAEWCERSGGEVVEWVTNFDDRTYCSFENGSRFLIARTERPGGMVGLLPTLGVVAVVAVLIGVIQRFRGEHESA